MVGKKSTRTVIGILALQGCVDRHIPYIESSGGIAHFVQYKEDLQVIDGLIIPGGESSTIVKCMKNLSLWDEIKRFTHHGPTWGICAGSIVMAREVQNSSQDSLSCIDIAVCRNGYGSQKNSFIGTVDDQEVAFIRAPIIAAVRRNVSVLAEFDGKPVFLRENYNMVTTFHAELSKIKSSYFHSYFFDMVECFKRKNI